MIKMSAYGRIAGWVFLAALVLSTFGLAGCGPNAGQPGADGHTAENEGFYSSSGYGGGGSGH